jgi:hypothetical protein
VGTKLSHFRSESGLLQLGLIPVQCACTSDNSVFTTRLCAGDDQSVPIRYSEIYTISDVTALTINFVSSVTTYNWKCSFDGSAGLYLRVLLAVV